MAHDGPSSPPTFFSEGKKTPEGRLVRRSVVIDDEEEVMSTSQSPRPMSDQKTPVPTRESAFGPEPPPGGRGANTSWSLDDQRREEYWKGYWDRKRQEREIERERERESNFYPDYRRQMRYIEYPEDEMEKGQVRYSFGGPPRSAHRRENASRPAMRMRRSSEAEALPQKSAETEYGDDENVETADHEGKRRMKKGSSLPNSPPRMLPRYKPSFDSASIDMRLPFLSWMGNTLKSHFVAALGEFVGTTLFLFFAFAGTQVANVGGRNISSTTTGGETGFSPEVLLYISLSFGFSLMVNVWVFFRISGGLFNPAVTLAMFLTKSITAFRSALLFAAQLLGSIFASFLVKVLFPTEFKVRTTLSKETSLVRGVFIEAFLTFELVFTIFLLAKEKHKATFIAPVGIGLSLFIAELVGVFYTGGSLNPARSFGPCVVTGIFDKEHWIYWVGPSVGAVVAVLFYNFIKMLEYEMANPGQDETSDAEALAAAQEVQETQRAKASGMVA
ncbi:hypothetical protein E2P81_ATG01334 [Venturia nashicola]|uniref:Aquaporin-like protein n=1 Tax=Venturia nashicola TaxID=86259 RepID=A0A4Z1PLW5_9PEZI|nr:hypothetical protein E6O75_ATG01364 [Venturia nashicola]TLD38791.1 hypothetical protein E2P81_ATG01334 [Venturia nashicola]